MSEWPDHNPYPSEKARQRAIRVRLVIGISVLAGAVFALWLRRRMGWE